MIKRISAFLFLFICSALLTSVVQAQSNIASTDFVSELSLSKSELVGGTKEEVAVTYKNEVPKNSDIFFEYGVAKEVKKGYITYFENISRETVAGDSVAGKLVVSVPNIVKESAEDTYVIYLKSYKSNDPESEHFVTSKSFSLKAGSGSFISIKNVNLLQSTGKRFNLKAGPSIYNPAEIAGDKSLATSTAIEITFTSNSEITLNPVIKFSKLRSDKFSAQINASPISIEKGDTYNVITLPTFEYEPGVYTGSLEFGNDLIKDTVQFQFIVAGDSVTVGQVSYVGSDAGHTFIYDIYGTPIDLNNIKDKDLENKNYDVSLAYIKNGKTIFTDTKSVDFSGQSFESIVPNKYSKIDSVDVVVKSQDGKIVYEGNKPLDVNTGKPIIIWIIIAVAIVLLIIILMIKKSKNQVAVVGATGLALLAILSASQVYAAWDPISYVTDSKATVYSREQAQLIADLGGTDKLVPRIAFNENISEKVYQTGENLVFDFKAVFLLCDNVLHGITTGFSLSSRDNAIATRTGFDVDSLDGTRVSETSVGAHNFYTQTIDFGRANLGPIDASRTHLYAHVYHNPLTGLNENGYSNYKIPLRVAPPVPTNLNATLNGCSSINLSWTASTGASSYKIYRSVNSGAETYLNTSTGTSFSDNLIEPGKTYAYTVTAVGGPSSAESTKTAPVSKTVPADCTAPLTCNISPSNPMPNQEVTWTAVWGPTFTGPATGATYTWSGEVTGNTDSVKKTFTTIGEKTVNLSATRDGNTYTASCPVNIGLCPAGTTYCSATNSCSSSCTSNLSCNVSRDISNPRRVTWSVNLLSGSDSDYDFVWTGDASGSNKTEIETYPEIDNRSATIVAKHKTTGVEDRNTCNIGGCPSGTIYCVRLNACTTSVDCPGGPGPGGPGAPSCGSRGNVAVGGVARVTDANLCGPGSELVAGSFGLRAGISQWIWSCRSTSTGGTINCNTGCVPPSHYNPVKGYCGDETCPDWCKNIEGLQPTRANYIIDEEGNCQPPSGTIEYFRPRPDTSSGTCPAFWKTTAGIGARMDCKVNGVSVPSQKLDETGVVGHPIEAGKISILSCNLVITDSDTVVRTETRQTKCYRLGEVREQ